MQGLVFIVSTMQGLVPLLSAAMLHKDVPCMSVINEHAGSALEAPPLGA